MRKIIKADKKVIVLFEDGSYCERDNVSEELFKQIITTQSDEEVYALMVPEYEQKITEATVSLIDVEACVKEIEKLTSLTEKEVYFESVIVRLGYEDCLVYLIEDDNLTISILTDTFTAADYVSIAKSAKEEFGNSTLVTVNIVKKVL